MRKTGTTWVSLLCAAGFAAGAQAYEVIGTENGSLLRGDATDPEDDGDEACVIAGGAPGDCGFGASFAANDEPGFSTDASGGGEYAFNVFDNIAGAFDAKWCCDPPSAGTDDPLTAEDESGSLSVQAEFADPLVVTGFLLVTGNDVQPDRDPDVFAVQGSADGVTYTDIYRYDVDGTSPFGAPSQGLYFRAGRDFALPPAYRIVRLRVYSTVGGTAHHLNEFEIFAAPTAPQVITTGPGCTLHDAILSANFGVGVRDCASGSIGADVIELGTDEMLLAADRGGGGDENHDGHTATLDGGRAGVPTVTEDLEIRAGAGAAIARDAALGCVEADPDAFRLLTVGAGATLTLTDLTLSNGCVAPADASAASGGAVLVAGGALRLDGTTFTGNTVRTAGSARTGAAGAAIAWGGAVHVAAIGELEISSSLFEGNAAHGGDGASIGGTAYGGAVGAASDLDAKVRDTTFRANAVAGGDASSGRGGTAVGAAMMFADGNSALSGLLVEANLASGGVGAEDGGGAGGPVTVLGVNLTVRDSRFTGNLALAGDGGSTMGGNVAGGGLLSGSDSLLLERSTFDANTIIGGAGPVAGRVSGGGLAISGDVGAVRNLTIVGNAAHGGDGDGGRDVAGGGAAIEFLAIDIQHLTVVDNVLTAGTAAVTPIGLYGGGIAALSGARIGHSLLRGNTVARGADPPAVIDCEGSNDGEVVVSLGHNRVEAVAASCELTAAGDLVGTAVPTAALAEQGCLAPLPDSRCVPVLALQGASTAALDAGDCATAAVGDDARGMPRPVDLPGLGDGADDCDIGAFEADDGDGDGVLDTEDNCPTTGNADQDDGDGDGLGDACDPDRDGDGLDDGADNCPAVANPDQADADDDDLGDACDACRSSYAPVLAPAGPFQIATNAAIGTVLADIDAENGGAADEGIGYDLEEFPAGDRFAIDDEGVITVRVGAALVAGPLTLRVSAADCAATRQLDVQVQVIAADADADGVADDGDNCPNTPNPDQADTDEDGVGDACDACFAVYPPVFLADGPFTLRVDAAVGTLIGDLDAENGAAPDAGVTYALVDGSDGLPITLEADGTLRVGGALAVGDYAFAVDAVDCASTRRTTVAVTIVSPPADRLFDSSFEAP